jgi:hypothetical protein
MLKKRVNMSKIILPRPLITLINIPDIKVPDVIIPDNKVPDVIIPSDIGDRMKKAIEAVKDHNRRKNGGGRLGVFDYE